MKKKLDLPQQLKPLAELSSNLWWSWNQDSYELFRRVDTKQWDSTHNPIITLKRASQVLLNELAGDRDYLKRLESVYKKYVDYMSTKETWFKKNYINLSNESFVYFCTEYAIHESLPLYSGGLGVLAGDHIKSCSDLDLPINFIGLFYKEGYFVQQINDMGEQVDLYQQNNIEDLPITPLKNEKGEDLKFTINFPDRDICVRALAVNVGRRTLYLLDTDLEENSKEDRVITTHLYGGDKEMRISQEIVLGVGGVRLLAHLGIAPSLFHMNEGHSCFFQLERVRMLLKENPTMSFKEAQILVASNCLFTTHTPVPAGNEAFSLPLMHKYFFKYIKDLKLTWSEFLTLGLVDEKSDSKYFSLTVLALNLSRFHNGVSELHGRISQKMWREIWKNVPEIENPITHITNGVHVQTWSSLEAKELYEKVLGPKWEDEIITPTAWEKFKATNDDLLRETKKLLKRKMITFVRDQLKKQHIRYGESPEKIKEIGTFLGENILTIGFARRFATYKRATLLFQDKERLAKIVNHPQFPVQFVFAGKAHPADLGGQKLIEEIYRFSQMPEFKGKIILLENYDMNISRHLVSGVDVWLNTPRRPLEASGTSGMKVPLNLGMNFSVLDGWWREGHNGKNGWIIGDEKDYPSDDIQDLEDSKNLYQTLEESIVSLYYDAPTAHRIFPSASWIQKTKEALISSLSEYSTHRMVKDYLDQIYVKAVTYGKLFREHKELAHQYATKWSACSVIWPVITFHDTTFSGQVYEVKSNYETTLKTPSHHVGIPLDDLLPGRVFKTTETTVTTNIYLGDLSTDDIVCELIITDFSSKNLQKHELSCVGMKEGGIYKFQGLFKSSDGRPKRLRLRVYPKLEFQNTEYELGLMSWF